MGLTDIDIGYIQENNLSFNDVLEMKKVSSIDRLKGITPRMKEYCRSRGISDIPDLDIVWNASKKNNIWRVGKR